MDPVLTHLQCRSESVTVSGDAGSDSISFNGLVSNSTLTGANDADTVIFSANADLVSLDSSFGSITSIIGSSGADTRLINGGNVGAATIRGGVGNDSMEFSGNLVSGVFAEMQALTSLPAASLLVLPELASGVDLVLTPLTSLISSPTLELLAVLPISGTKKVLTPSSLLMASVSVPLMTMSVPITESSLVSTLMLP